MICKYLIVHRFFKSYMKVGLQSVNIWSTVANTSATTYLIMKAYVILHNMIVEDERDLYGLGYDYEHVDGTTPEPIVQWNHYQCYSAYLHRVLQV